MKQTICKNCEQELIYLAGKLWGHGTDDIDDDNKNPKSCTKPEPLDDEAKIVKEFNDRWEYRARARKYWKG